MDLRVQGGRGARCGGRDDPPIRGGRHGHIFAAVDLGTNNCRLLIARPTADGFEVIDSFSRIVRLGEGLGGTGRLNKSAMDRTVRALAICARKMRRHRVSRSRNIATEACRRAANGRLFLDRVQAETGLSFEVIGAEEEATLALSGCAPLLDYDCSHALVFDIGGGSTELMWLELGADRRPRILDCTSLRCGVVTLAERYGGRSVPLETYRVMVDDVTDRLAGFEIANGITREIERSRVHMLGTSGTVTTLAAIHLDLPKYDRSRVDGRWFTIDDLQRASARLSSMGYGDRVRHPCIRRGRADLVVAGCAILEAIMRIWPVGTVCVADRGLREGMLIALMEAADAAVTPS